MFDEQPERELHGECAAEIHRLESEREALRALLAEARLLIDEQDHLIEPDMKAAGLDLLKRIDAALI